MQKKKNIYIYIYIHFFGKIFKKNLFFKNILYYFYKMQVNDQNRHAHYF